MKRTIQDATVEGVKTRKTQTTKHYVYSVKITWSDGQVNVIARRYSEFLALQDKVLHLCKDIYGKCYEKKLSNFAPLPGKRIHGKSPGTAMTKLERITQFVKKLLRLPTSISQSDCVLEFFKPTLVDLQVQKRSVRAKTSVRGKLKRLSTRKRKDSMQISSPVVCPQYEVIADYEKEHKNGIDLTRGTVVDVLQRRETGWWLVDYDSKQGWVPASYLEGDDDTEEDMVPVTFPKGQGAVYIATESYTAQFEDELSLDVGVTLQVSEINMSGWWKAIYLGNEGLVPAVCLHKLGEPMDARSRKTHEVTSRRQRVPTRRRTVRFDLGISPTKEGTLEPETPSDAQESIEELQLHEERAHVSQVNGHPIKDKQNVSRFDKCRSRNGSFDVRSTQHIRLLRSALKTNAIEEIEVLPENKETVSESWTETQDATPMSEKFRKILPAKARSFDSKAALERSREKWRKDNEKTRSFLSGSAEMKSMFDGVFLSATLGKSLHDKNSEDATSADKGKKTSFHDHEKIVDEPDHSVSSQTPADKELEKPVNERDHSVTSQTLADKELEKPVNEPNHSVTSQASAEKEKKRSLQEHEKLVDEPDPSSPCDHVKTQSFPESCDQDFKLIVQEVNVIEENTQEEGQDCKSDEKDGNGHSFSNAPSTTAESKAHTIKNTSKQLPVEPHGDDSQEKQKSLLRANWVPSQFNQLSPSYRKQIEKKKNLEKSQSFNGSTDLENFLDLIKPSWISKKEKPEPSHSFLTSTTMRSLFEGIVVSTLFQEVGDATLKDEGEANEERDHLRKIRSSTKSLDSPREVPDEILALTLMTKSKSMIELRTKEYDTEASNRSPPKESAKKTIDLRSCNEHFSECTNFSEPTSKRIEDVVESNINEYCYQAIEDFPGSDDGHEVALRKSEVVAVIRKAQSGWWYVKTLTDEGWAPSNYLQKK